MELNILGGERRTKYPALFIGSIGLEIVLIQFLKQKLFYISWRREKFKIQLTSFLLYFSRSTSFSFYVWSVSNTHSILVEYLILKSSQTILRFIVKVIQDLANFFALPTFRLLKEFFFAFSMFQTTFKLIKEDWGGIWRLFILPASSQPFNVNSYILTWL